jgi:hypothetical protein
MTRSHIDAVIIEATKGIADEDGRKASAEAPAARLRTAAPERSAFPGQWRSEPNVMFETADPRPEPFEWGERKWTTERAYDEDLAAFLGDLACGRDVADAQTRGLVRRALEPAQQEGAPDRLWHKLFAARVIGTDCPPAAELPQDMRRQLEQLAARGDAVPASPETSQPDSTE